MPSPSAMLRHADALAASGDLSAAHRAYEALASSPTPHPGSLERLCHSLLLLSRPSEAFACAARARSLLPASPFLLSLEAEAAAATSDLPAAAAAYAAARALSPSSYDACFNLGLTLHAMGEAEGAAEALAAATRLAPGAAEAYTALGRALAVDDERAEAAWRGAAAAAPREAGARVELGSALLAAGRAAEAEEALAAAVAMEPRSGAAAFGRAQALRALRRPCEAVRWLRQSASLAPRDADTAHAAGLAAQACARHGGERSSSDEARRWFARALELSPRRTDTLSMLLHPFPPSPYPPPASEPPPPPAGRLDGAALSVEAAAGGACGEEWRREARRLLEAHGAVRIGGVVPAEAAEALARHLREVEEDGEAPETTNTTFSRRRRRHLAVSLRSAAVAEAARHVAAAVLPLLCAHAPCSLRLVESGLLLSFPRAAAQPLHSDTDGSAAAGEARAIKLQVGTARTTAAMGPLEVVPGSHAWGGGAGPRVGAADAVALPLRVGSVVVYDARVWHRGGANKSRRRRPVFYLTVLVPPGHVPEGLPFTIYPEDVGCFLLTARGIEEGGCGTHPVESTARAVSE